MGTFTAIGTARCVRSAAAAGSARQQNKVGEPNYPHNTQLQQRPRSAAPLAPASAVTVPGRLLQALVRCVRSVPGNRLGPRRDTSLSLRLPQATINALA